MVGTPWGLELVIASEVHPLNSHIQARVTAWTLVAAQSTGPVPFLQVLITKVYLNQNVVLTN